MSTARPPSPAEEPASAAPTEWPVSEERVLPTPPPLPDETLAQPPVAPVPPDAGPPAGFPPQETPADRIGLGILLGLVLLAVVAGLVAAVLLTRDNGNKAGPTTIVVTETAKASAGRPPLSARVPSLVGQTRSAAEAALRRARLAATIAVVPGAPPAGKVLAQAPPPGTRRSRGETVRINVSSGTKAAPPAKAAPKPAGATGAAAATAATPAATPAPATTASSATPAATATASTPQPAARSAPVPALSGDVRAAAGRLSADGFRISLAYVPSDDPLGTVEAQAPAPGSSAPTGSHVTVNVSIGPGKKAQKSVPDVGGKTVDEALATLNGAGLRLIVLKQATSDETEVGKVVEQTPKPGATAPANAQVVVYWGALRK